MPAWLTELAVVSLAIGGICAVVITADLLAGHAQKMWIMDLVWPITALWAGLLGLWAYFRFGRDSSKAAMRRAEAEGQPPPAKRQPLSVIAGKGATHCGAGCTLGDIMAEWLVLALPLSLFGHKMFGAWIYDYVLAFACGIAFQYFTITPMKNLSPGKGIVAALKADALSLSAWQLGMFGWMAIVTFAIFGHELRKSSPVFWFMMQIAMLFGFLSSYPVNWLLIRKGIKERM